MSHPPGPPGPAYGGQPEHPYGPYYGPTTNGKATASLAVGIGTLVFSWCCGFGLLGVIAILLGARARSEIRASYGAQDGDGLALGGIITGAIAIVVALLGLALIGLALFAGGSYDAATTRGIEM